MVAVAHALMPSKDILGRILLTLCVTLCAKYMNMDLGFEIAAGVENNEWNFSNIINNIETLPSPYNNNPHIGSQEQAPLSMLEPYSHLQQAFVPMTPNSFVHLHGYIPMQSEPTDSSMYSLSYDSQTMVPSGDEQQAVRSMQFTGSQSLSDQMNGYNHLLSTPDFQCQSSILHESTTLSSNFASSQALSTRNLGLSDTWRNEGMSSRVFSSKFSEITSPLRLERASRVQPEQVTFASENELITTQRGKEKLPEPSTRAKPSKEIQRILNMNPKGRLSLYGTTSIAPPQRSQSLDLQNGRDSLMDNLEKQLARNEPDHTTSRMLTIGEQGQYEPRCRGRPRKSYQLHKETTNVGSALSIQEANKTLGNEDQNANPTNLFYSLQIPNALYDPNFARNGVPVDPYLRLFGARLEN